MIYKFRLGETKMGYTDEAAKELFAYRPALTKPNDYDSFWEETLEESRRRPLRPQRTRIDYPSRHAAVYDIRYDGFDGTPIHGWYIVPEFIGRSSYPCLIHYHGFGGDRGRPCDLMHWAMAGFAVLSVDCRDQGGQTGDLAGYSAGHMMNVACKGVNNKYEYYFRSVYMDSVRAVDFVCAQPETDPGKLVVEGGSQGGALGMAVAALDDRPALALVDVPSNSNLVKRVEGAHGAFASVAEYLKRHPDETDLVLHNLSYFDTMNMADRIRCRVLASVALKDEVCPPLMYFATYNRIESDKEIVIYPFNGHEGGGSLQTERKLAFAHKHCPDWFA